MHLAARRLQRAWRENWLKHTKPSAIIEEEGAFCSVVCCRGCKGNDYHGDLTFCNLWAEIPADTVDGGRTPWTPMGIRCFRPLFFECYTADGPLKIKTFHPYFPDNFDVSKYLHAYGLGA